MLSEDIEQFGDHYDIEPPPVDRGGRPTVITEAVIQKLGLGYSMGFTNAEAALFCGVSESALGVFLSKNPKFKEWRDQLKQSPKLKAKLALFKNLTADNPKLCLSVLERLSPDEYGKQVRIDKTVTEIHLTDAQMREQILSLSKDLGIIVDGEFDEVKQITDICKEDDGNGEKTAGE